jgi:hypothetical protein
VHGAAQGKCRHQGAELSTFFGDNAITKNATYRLPACRHDAPAIEITTTAKMKPLTKQEVAQFLASATVTETSEEDGVIIARRGICADGTSFVLINRGPDGTALLFLSA